MALERLLAAGRLWAMCGISGMSNEESPDKHAARPVTTVMAAQQDKG
ncbi:hypothetical protein IVB02_29075 [Bradyrhizobium sp. 166]|nr:hypothetical protein [Bradyrhizobium sp. 166]MCK1605346.1 hypothetical protein [Bradyrhizobium sp. 166]